MQLSQFILKDMEQILGDWERFAGSLPIARSMTGRQLRDHAELMLRAIAAEISQSQTNQHALERSRGEHDAQSDSNTPAQEHAVRRLEEGFSLPELVSEYRALRSSVIRRWRHDPDVPADALDQVVRFNEAIDQALAESVVRFSAKVDRARELFMGALGHDLRGPLHVILRGTSYLKDPELPAQKREQIGGFVTESAEHMHRLIEDLLDVARTKLGGSLPIVLKPTDAAEICARVAAELRAQNPDHVFEVRTTGDLRGLWDSGRLEQLLSNLASNAVQHGDPNKPIRLEAAGTSETLVLRVHNEGTPIPSRILGRIFEPLVRGNDSSDGHSASGHMGLGLYIACTVARAHGGSIHVQSSEAEGTTFEVSLPKGTLDLEVQPTSRIGEEVLK